MLAWPNPPSEIISCLTSIFCFHISYRIKEAANDINNHLTVVIIWTLFLGLSSGYENHKSIHVAFFIFYSLKPKVNQFGDPTLGFSYFPLWPFSTERLSWIQS